MQNMICLYSPIATLTAMHNNGNAAKRNSTESNGLMLKLYLSVGAELMLTYNQWVDVGFHNGAKLKVVGILYNHSSGYPMNNVKKLPEDAVV